MSWRQLGSASPQVFPIALGCMGMSGMYGESDEQESLATIHAAIDAGINLIDTGDFYGSGHNEMLIGRALRARRDEVLLSVKFGALRTPEGGWGSVDNRPAAIRNSLAYTLKRLGVDYVDIYRPARVDPAVPIEDTVGAIADLITAGWVRYLGLSEAGVETIRRACAVHPVADLQIEYSLVTVRRPFARPARGLATERSWRPSRPLSALPRRESRREPEAGSRTEGPCGGKER